MRRALVLALALGSFTTVGCDATLQNQLCHRSWRVAHPTMTPEEISIGPEARVHQISEGPKGGLPGGTTSRVD